MSAVEQADQASFIEAFHSAHRAQHGHDNPGRPIEIVTCRAQAVGLVAKDAVRRPPAAIAAAQWGERQIYFGPEHGWTVTRVYRRDSLAVGTELNGPVVVEEMSSTTVVLPGQQALVDRFGNIRIQS